MGISKSAYSQLENGHVEITINKIDALAKLFQIPVGQLLPMGQSVSQVAHGNGHNLNGHTNTINNYFATPEEKLEELAKQLQNTIAELKQKSNNQKKV